MKFKISINLVWLQKYILQPLGLVFWVKFDESNKEWPSDFPIEIGIVKGRDYL